MDKTTKTAATMRPFLFLCTSRPKTFPALPTIIRNHTTFPSLTTLCLNKVVPLPKVTLTSSLLTSLCNLRKLVRKQTCAIQLWHGELFHVRFIESSNNQ